MKILQVIPSLAIGGAEVFTSELSSELVQLGHKVDLINITGLLEERVLRCINPGIDIVNLYLRPYSFKVFKEIKRVLNRNEYDAIISHLTPCLLQVGFAIKNSSCSSSWIHVEHSIQNGTINNLYTKFVAKKLYANTSAIVTVSEIIKHKLMIENYPILKEKCYTIHNGIDTKRWCIPTVKNINNDLKTFAIVGRLEKVKGHIEFIKTLALNKNKLIGKIKIIIAGSGSMEHKIKACIYKHDLKKMIILKGHCDNPRDIYLDSDCVLIPSRWEGLPIALLEAMSCGRMVISMAVGGIPEVLDNDCGILIQPGKYDRFVESIIDVANGKVNVDIMGHNARKKVEKTFSLNSSVNKYIMLIDQLKNK